MSRLLYGFEMNGYNHPTEAACHDAKMPGSGRRGVVLPQPRVMFLPLLAVGIGMAVTELGLWHINDQPVSGLGLDSATAWVLQTFITGQIAIFVLAAWGHSLCRFQWPRDRPAQLNLWRAAAGACFGWTMWMALRISVVETDELIAPLFVFSLPILAITVPLLWHTTLKLGSPHRSFWVPAGFLAFCLLLQCWGTPRIAEDPVNLFILNSALIVAAVVLWLIVYSLPPAAAPSQATQ